MDDPELPESLEVPELAESPEALVPLGVLVSVTSALASTALVAAVLLATTDAVDVVSPARWPASFPIVNRPYAAPTSRSITEAPMIAQSHPGIPFLGGGVLAGPPGTPGGEPGGCCAYGCAVGIGAV